MEKTKLMTNEEVLKAYLGNRISIMDDYPTTLALILKAMEFYHTQFKDERQKEVRFESEQEVDEARGEQQRELTQTPKFKSLAESGEGDAVKFRKCLLTIDECCENMALGHPPEKVVPYIRHLINQVLSSEQEVQASVARDDDSSTSAGKPQTR